MRQPCGLIFVLQTLCKSFTYGSPYWATKILIFFEGGTDHAQVGKQKHHYKLIAWSTRFIGPRNELKLEQNDYTK